MDLNRADVALVRGRLRAIATWSSASRRGCRTTWWETTISRRCGARRRRLRPFDLPVMIHMGQSVSRCAPFSLLLKRGDVVTHV